MRRSISTTLLVIAFLYVPQSLSAQHVYVRLSVKYILNASNNRPSGFYTQETNILDIIEGTNRAMERWGRGYRFVVTEFRNVTNASQFFSVDNDAEYRGLENSAEANPGQFFWRLDAVNVFIVDSLFAGGGASAIPSCGSCGDTGYRLVVFSVSPNPNDVIWAHELGHHFDLYHPFSGGPGGDFVADTRPDPNPNQCNGPFTCNPGGTDECCCTVKINNLVAASTAGNWSSQEFGDIRFNLMSYYGLCPPVATYDNIRLTEGQLDRWTDATRRYHPVEVSGLTWFVDRANSQLSNDGYSTNPYRTVVAGITAATSGGDRIVSIRSGSYNEQFSTAQRVTLRATRGWVTIGR
jgi:hypothetical protein